MLFSSLESMISGILLHLFVNYNKIRVPMKLMVKKQFDNTNDTELKF